MKRLFSFSFAVIFAVSLFADNVLPKSFLGLTIGKTPKSEVQAIMRSQGFELIDQQDVNATTAQYQFSGTYKHEGVEFHTIITSFLSDTLFIFCPQDSCGADKVPGLANTLQTNLEKKYGALETADSTLLFMMLKDSADHYGVETWSRMDDHTMLISMKSEAKITCMYVDRDLYFNMMMKGLMQLSEALNELPDYKEENKVYGVAGVKFGDDMATVKRVIAPKSEKLTDSDSHTLTYYKTKIGGSTYDFATFYFMQGKGLVSVNLQNAFYSWKKEEAEMAYEGIISQFKRRYSNFQVRQDERDEKMCTCGAYIDGYDYPPIIITFQKSLSKGGDIMYYVMVSYYEMRKANLYDDEI